MIPSLGLKKKERTESVSTNPYSPGTRRNTILHGLHTSYVTVTHSPILRPRARCVPVRILSQDGFEIVKLPNACRGT
jgi:hypothetical protein